jgi:Phosphotransferase enzyme family
MSMGSSPANTSQSTQSRARQKTQDAAVEATSNSGYPSGAALAAALKSIFRSDGSPRTHVQVLDRKPASYSTTFPCEIVTCRLQGASQVRLFCKYAGGIHYTGHGHRGGVQYEIEVYRDILEPLELSRPRFYGGYTDPQAGQHWLFLEYLRGSLRIGKIKRSGAMEQAAGWIAQFHAYNEVRLRQESMPFLKTYDLEYYLGWVRRTSEFTDSLRQRFPWLATVYTAAKEVLATLVSPQATIIHGEYYPHNILYQRGHVFPVDWESAAVADGLIDLASLIQEWDEDTVRRCELEYQRVRWPDGSPPDFERRLNAARLYLHFRWLGDRPEWSTREHSFVQLKLLCSEMGIL